MDSELDLPWLLRGPEITDRRVHVGLMPALRRGSLRESVASHEPDLSVLSYERTCRIEVRGGSTILVAGETPVSNEQLASFVVGVGMGVLQHQLGRLVLHASAVRSPVGAIGFLGDSSWGKSTTAAALYRGGWPLITDDVTAFDVGPGDGLRVLPSYPFLKLRPDAFESLGLSSLGSPPIYPGAVKRRFRADRGFELDAIRLQALYVLGEGEGVEVNEVGAHAAFAEVLRHTFTARVLEDVGPQGWHVELAAELVRTTRVRRLLSPVTPTGGMTAIVRAIREDLGMAA